MDARRHCRALYPTIQLHDATREAHASYPRVNNSCRISTKSGLNSDDMSGLMDVLMVSAVVALVRAQHQQCILLHAVRADDCCTGGVDDLPGMDEGE